MEAIPISFEHEGKQYNATLKAVLGAGGNVWYLWIDKFYHGCLTMTSRGWVFHGKFSELAGYFGERVMERLNGD